MDILSIIVPAAATIVVACIEMVAAKERRKSQKSAQKRDELHRLEEERRIEENRLAMEMAFANLQLSIVCSNALTGGHNNGNVERARVAAEKAENAYRTYLRKIVAEVVA